MTRSKKTLTTFKKATKNKKNLSSDHSTEFTISAKKNKETLVKQANLIRSAIEKRKHIVSLLGLLEEAWKNAIKPSLALNRPLSSKEENSLLTDKSEILEAEKKKRRIEALQQKTFFLFQDLTEDKNEEQITLGEKTISQIQNILQLQLQLQLQSQSQLQLQTQLQTQVQTQVSPNLYEKEYNKVKSLTTDFFKKENSSNKKFIKNANKSCKKVGALLKEATNIRKLTCRDKKICELINEDLTLLEDFLKSIEELLKY